jgi:HEAT repeat protein
MVEAEPGVTPAPAGRQMSMHRPCAILVAIAALACQPRDEPMAAGKPLSHWKREATQVSLFTFLNSDKDERRGEAFRRLREMGGPAVPALLDLLRHRNISVSSDAFNAIANMGPTAAAAVPELHRLLHGEDPELRREAAWLLGTIGPAAEPAVPSLEKLLEHPDKRLREVAAKSLGLIGGAGRVALDRARTTGDAGAREAATHGSVAESLDPARRRDIVARALDDESAPVRTRAVELLITADRGEADALAPLLVRALADPDAGVRHAGHRVLSSWLRDARATPTVLAGVLAGAGPSARADVAWHVGNAARDPVQRSPAPRDSSVVAALLGALDDEDPKVRIYAARALAYGEPAASRRAVERLRRDVATVEPILAVRGARALWDVNHSVAEVRPAYEGGLTDSAKWNRVETISAVLDMGPAAQAFVPHLERLTNDPDPEVRQRAERALHYVRRR